MGATLTVGGSLVTLLYWLLHYGNMSSLMATYFIVAAVGLVAVVGLIVLPNPEADVAILAVTQSGTLQKVEMGEGEHESMWDKYCPWVGGANDEGYTQDFLT